MVKIAVIDYGMGNLRSVSKALEKVSPEAKVMITSDSAAIDSADKVVLPGVGAIKDCLAEIDRLSLREVILNAAANKPFLGICLGMQALLNSSEECGGRECLGVIPGQVVRFGAQLNCDETGEHLKVPHMGWNRVVHAQPHPLWNGIESDSRFYFVHSYHAQTDSAQHSFGKTTYGIGFSAAIGRENIFAVQFHPEKSQNNGLQLLENFINWKI
ncbi:MAG: imidazole glycerol phosphate synthase subunit HisH [Gammaproteobacteria bacterium]|nr:MAG: imidazole glycerol phosphate synthase subunit HisH [Gammaproteobacteria bacterium]